MEFFDFFFLGSGSQASSKSPRAEDGEVKIDLYVYRSKISLEFATPQYQDYLDKQSTLEEAGAYVLRIAVFPEVQTPCIIVLPIVVIFVFETLDLGSDAARGVSNKVCVRRRILHWIVPIQTDGTQETSGCVMLDPSSIACFSFELGNRRIDFPLIEPVSNRGLDPGHVRTQCVTCPVVEL